jgi:hypothetical protein
MKIFIIIQKRDGFRERAQNKQSEFIFNFLYIFSIFFEEKLAQNGK